MCRRMPAVRLRVVLGTALRIVSCIVVVSGVAGGGRGGFAYAQKSDAGRTVKAKPVRLLNLPALWYKSPKAVKHALEAAHAKVVSSRHHSDHRATTTLIVRFPKGITMIAEFAGNKLADVEIVFPTELDWRAALSACGLSPDGVVANALGPSQMFDSLWELTKLSGLPVKPSTITGSFGHYTDSAREYRKADGVAFRGRYYLEIASLPLGQ